MSVTWGQVNFVISPLHLFSLRIGTFSTERGMGQFISAAAFKLRQSFSTSTDFIRIGSRVFIFDRRQWISAGAFNSAWTFNSLNSVTSVNKVHCVDFQCPLPYRGALCRYEATFAGVVSQLTTPMQSADLRWTDADSQWEKVYKSMGKKLKYLKYFSDLFKSFRTMLI